MRAWRYGTGGWEDVEPDDVKTMKTIDEGDLRPFMKTWAVDFH